MKFVYPIFLIALLSSCGESNPTTPDGKPDGKALYEQNCSICHGDDGKLGSAGSKDLSISTFTMEERIQIITNGKNSMAPFKGVMDDSQIKAVAEYIESLRK